MISHALFSSIIDFDNRYFLFFSFEYERLQRRERDILRQMYNIQIEPTSTYMNSRLKSTLDLNDRQRDQLEDLQRKNLRLERERRGKTFHRVV